MFLLLTSIACSVAEIPEETNTILRGLMEESNNKNYFSTSLVDSLDLPERLTINLFEGLIFGKILSSEGDSIITKSDINSWNKKISNYKPGKLSKNHISGIHAYDIEEQNLFNTNCIISDFDNFVKISIPFLSQASDKALLYIEYFPGPDIPVKNSYLLVLRKDSDKWKVTYRGSIVISTPS